MKLRFKLLTIVGIMLLISLALTMVRGLIAERTERAREVERSLSEYGAGEQNVTGPYLLLPYTETIWKQVSSEVGKAPQWIKTERELTLSVAPHALSVSGQMNVELLRRGLYQAPTYLTTLQLRGHFSMPDLPTVPASPGAGNHLQNQIAWKTPQLGIALRDSRGIRKLQGRISETPLEFAPNSLIEGREGGVHASLPSLAKVTTIESGQALAFVLELQLAGSQSLMIEPIGKQNDIQLTGNWPHPSFDGDLAPLSRKVSEEGFTVNWEASQLATGSASVKCQEEQGTRTCARFPATEVGLRLIDPVDRYVLSERTAKYGELFMLLTFGAVFLMELLRRIAVHPMQYALTGLALALFFLLTLSLSEHVTFFLAYWVAAIASIALIAYYAGHMLGGMRHGLGFGALLTALYGLLFGILRSEDAALLVGSLTLFALLAAFMILTRNIDWFTFGNQQADANKAKASKDATIALDQPTR